jgi:hypothetical protein
VNDYSTQRLTVPDAAKALGITPEAIRQRIKRGTIEFEHTEDGRYYVYITPTEASQASEEVGNEVENTLQNTTLLDYIETLKREVEDWKEEARRKDTIIMTMAQRIPELEPAKEATPEPPNGHETASEGQGNGAVPQEDNHRSWLRRFFGL